ncbi:MAG: hypothetical protein AUK47_01900 [Deltaproteobacteria bacterium CG2_30_63_29]|nr:MAG: hypothetical protein AUK47_01900 [Deltaproteobacteria bacterium CG2_30_63_29]PJB39148.1 MAG: hypothetical protein CO108_17730 [Deltaproteobacteria bacterium CG_4_9_14_3_um_filter_63_12]
MANHVVTAQVNARHFLQPRHLTREQNGGQASAHKPSFGLAGAEERGQARLARDLPDPTASQAATQIEGQRPLGPVDEKDPPGEWFESLGLSGMGIWARSSSSLRVGTTRQVRPAADSVDAWPVPKMAATQARCSFLKMRSSSRRGRLD